MTKNNGLLDITHNPIDQCLSFAYLFAKILLYSKNRTNLTHEQLKAIFQSKMQIESFYSKIGPNLQKVLNDKTFFVLINILMGFLSSTRDTFDNSAYNRFVQ